MSEQGDTGGGESTAVVETEGGETRDAVPGEGQQRGESAAAAARRHRLVVAGNEEEVDDKGLVDALAEAIGGHDKLRDLGQISRMIRRERGALSHKEKEILEAVADLKDPRRRWTLLERLAGGREKLRAETEDWYHTDLEQRKLPPEEREARELKSQLEQMRAEKAKLEEERSERERSAAAEEMIPRLGRMFTAELTAAGVADVDGEMIADVAKYVEDEIATIRTEAEYTALVKEAARAVARKHTQTLASRLPKLPKETRAAALREALKGMTPDEVAELLGEDGVRAFRKHDIERVRGKGSSIARPQAGGAARAANGKREKVSLDDFFNGIRKEPL